MSFSYDFTTAPAISYVRLLIPDTVAPGIFQDDEINAFMELNRLQWQSAMFYSASAGAYLPYSPSNYFRAAALALNTLAGSTSRLAAVTQLLDVKLSPDKAAKALQDTAQRYLDMDDNSGAIAIAEQVGTVWAWRDRFLAQMQRQTGGMPIS